MASAFQLFRMATHPSVALGVTWLACLAIYAVASHLGSEFAYFNTLVSIEGIVDDSSAASYAWLLTSGMFFGLGIFMCNGIPLRPPAAGRPGTEAARATKVLTWAFLITGSVALAWVGGAVAQFGGIGNLAALAASDNTLARQAVVSASFPGGRLVSSGFIGLAVYATALLFNSQAPLNRHQRMRVSMILLVSLVYLGVIPILVSGRVNFFVAVIASLVAACYSAQRIVSVRYMALGAALLSMVWTAKQYFTLSHISEESTALQQGYEGLIFYIYNDVLNALNTLADTSGVHTLGWYSVRFVFFFTFTDKPFNAWIANEKEHITQYVTAGEVPLLASPIVDFGLAGLLLVMAFGAWSQHWYRRACHDAGSCSIYGITLACLLLSVHATFLTSQEVVYSMMLVGLMSRSPRRQHQPASVPRPRARFARAPR